MDGFDPKNGMWLIANSYAYDEGRKLGLKRDALWAYVMSRRAIIKKQLEDKTYKFGK